MNTVQIELPEGVLRALKETPEGLSREIRRAAAAKLYELGRLSSGRAAELAGMSRVGFLDALAGYGVSALQVSEEELADDVGNA